MCKIPLFLVLPQKKLSKLNSSSQSESLNISTLIFCSLPGISPLDVFPNPTNVISFKPAYILYTRSSSVAKTTGFQVSAGISCFS